MTAFFVGYLSVEKDLCTNKHAFSYNPEKSVYIYNCSGSMETKLPESIPHLANWVIYDDNNITSLCGDYSYLHDEKYNVTELSIASSRIKRICNEHIDECQVNSLEQLLTGYSLQLLDLSGNDFQPSKIFKSSMTQMGKTQILLGGNTTHCDCSALDLADFLNKSRTIVKDYKDVKCSTGIPGLPVYKLRTEEKYLRNIKCFPPNPLQVASGIIIGGIIFLTFIFYLMEKNKKLLRWLIYKHTGIFIREGTEREDIFFVFIMFLLALRYNTQITIGPLVNKG